MNQNCIIPFKITSIDSLGQGVSKISDKVTFIPKTFIGDEGKASVVTQKKGVIFAKIHELTVPSSKRIEPECPHFSNCQSCHFLHVSYDEEIDIKTNSLRKLFEKLSPPEIQIIKSPVRLGYRNRVQLHYDRIQKKLGYINRYQNDLIPVSGCKIGNPEITEVLKNLFENDQWLKLLPKGSPPKGHLEIYQKSSELAPEIFWNKPYAEGGFTQVFPKMNSNLKDIITQKFSQITNLNVLDLFAGNGNLSNSISFQKRLCFDQYTKPPGAEFISQNLYHPKAFNEVKKIIKNLEFSPDLLVLDPPRSGFKELNSWSSELNPSKIIYVSCDPHTLVRDLLGLHHYKISELFLLDFFPSSYHFETMVFLERKS